MTLNQPVVLIVFAVSCMCYLAHSASVVSPVASSTVAASSSAATTVKLVESTTPTPPGSTEAPVVTANVTELPEELTTIIEIEETDGNSTESLDFVNLPGYGVVDDANSTANASQFSCYNRRYGYYADIAKKCFMFHLCYPVQEPTTGQLIFQRFSFVCSDNAVFDQQHLVCVDNETLSYPCSDAHKYFIESNNKLIESMQQNAAAMNQQGAGQLPPGLPGAQAAIAPGQSSVAGSSVVSSPGGEESTEEGASVVALPGGPAALTAAESSEMPLVNASAILDSDAAAQYALLEQLFG